ncbi:hypothetical protein [Hyunsoonleella aestuarii]|uniref:Uncharacterized protein n=1 Tax=Hyunsoonleella aestuarii TaxID=912802 RepID=A0ABP8E7J6_9FLAO|nr:hypothetical protein [Hyunsoonleella aestuarii]
MELVLSSENVEPLPRQKEDLIVKPSNFLNSSYKNVVESNYSKMNSNSLFGIRQSVKSHFFVSSSVAATAIKLSVFLTIALLILN